MKKLLSIFVALLLLAVFFIPSRAQESLPEDCTGVWVPFYGGNPTPMYEMCAESEGNFECWCGDTRPVVIE